MNGSVEGHCPQQPKEFHKVTMLPVTFISLTGCVSLPSSIRKPLYTIREVTGTAITVTAIEACNQDALFNICNQSVQVHRPVSELDVKVH